MTLIASGSEALSDAEFAAVMGQLGPWVPDSPGLPPVALAVSGGGDSLCLALLARRWRRNVVAFVVDHGLRPESAAEAALTIERLVKLDIPARCLTLVGLAPGGGLSARARSARYDALTRACRDVGAIDLLVGHHANDQHETAVIRERAASGPDGMACMAWASWTADIRVVRPLLGFDRARLQARLRAEGVDWVEDPSNQNPKWERARVRQALSGWDPALHHSALEQVARAGDLRHRADDLCARELAQYATLFAEGCAYVERTNISVRSLGALIRAVSGSDYVPSRAILEHFVVNPCPVTMAGVRIMHGGRLGDGWLIVREAQSVAGPQVVCDGLTWDDRFRVACSPEVEQRKLTISALGPRDASKLDRRGRWSSAVRQVLPAIRHGNDLLSVPHLGMYRDISSADIEVTFLPSTPATDPRLWGDLSQGRED